MKLNVWKKIADVIIKIVEQGELDSALLPMLGGLAPAFLLKVSAHLDITVDDHMKQIITQNPIVEPLLMDAETLISSTSRVQTFDDESLFAYMEATAPA